MTLTQSLKGLHESHRTAIVREFRIMKKYLQMKPVFYNESSSIEEYFRLLGVATARLNRIKEIEDLFTQATGSALRGIPETRGLKATMQEQINLIERAIDLFLYKYDKEDHMDKKVVESIRKILNTFGPEEHEHFENMANASNEVREHHIYIDIERVQKWLDESHPQQ